MSFDAAAFVSRFALPLVKGGEVHVERPIGEREIAALLALEERGAAETYELTEARAKLAAPWLVAGLAPELDEDSARLLALAANLLFLLHPQVRGDLKTREAFIRESVLRQIVEYSEELVEGFSVDAGADRVVARHTLVGRFPVLRRSDVTLRYWVGSRSYLGQPPPPRLLRWRDLRRVRLEEQKTTVLAEATTRTYSWEGAATSRLVRHLLTATPLSDLLAADRDVPPFALLPSVRILGDARLARGLCAHVLSPRGRSVLDAFSRALFSYVSRGRGADDHARLGLQFLCHVHLLSAEGPLGGDPPRPEDDRPERSQLEYYALYAAVAAAHAAWPSDVAGDAALMQRIWQYAARCRRFAGPLANPDLYRAVAPLFKSTST